MLVIIVCLTYANFSLLFSFCYFLLLLVRCFYFSLLYVFIYTYFVYFPLHFLGECLSFSQQQHQCCSFVCNFYCFVATLLLGSSGNLFKNFTTAIFVRPEVRSNAVPALQLFYCTVLPLQTAQTDLLELATIASSHCNCRYYYYYYSCIILCVSYAVMLSCLACGCCRKATTFDALQRATALKSFLQTH